MLCFPTELWVGIVFSSLFGLVMFILLGLLAFHRGFPKFMIVAIVAAAGETAGWIARTYGHVDPFGWNGYITQTICLILSPAFISAANYMAFQNVMDVFGNKWSRIPRKYYVIGFCIGDLFSLIVQAVGGALSAEANTPSEVSTGSNVMIAGVSVQVVVTAPFMLLSTTPTHKTQHLVFPVVQRESSFQTDREARDRAERVSEGQRRIR